MITERGWSAIGAGIGLVVLWWALGGVELLATGLVLIGAVALGVVIVTASSPAITVTRQLRPNLVHEGDQSAVTVQLTNRGRRPLRNVVIEDTVSNLGSARFAVGKIKPGQTVTATYQILCRPRGIYMVGPASVTVQDPMRMATSSFATEQGDRLIVYPTVEDLEGFPVVRGLDPTVRAARPEFSHQGGEDFFTLREYQLGDDLRRVHWRSSAKRDKLMIRQLETPWQARALILFDPRATSFETSAAFERGVRGAASVIRHLMKLGFSADLWAGRSPVLGSDGSPYTAAMEMLAGVAPIEDLDIRAASLSLRGRARGGALVLITGVPDQELLAAQRLLSRDFDRTLLLTVSETSSTSVLQFQRAGAITVSIGPNDPWGPAWIQGVQSAWSIA